MSNVAKKASTDVIEFDVSVFEADAGRGMENMGQEDLALPFLKVLSGNDPVLDTNENARKGDIYNTVTGALYKGMTASASSPAPTSEGSSSGLPEALARVRR